MPGLNPKLSHDTRAVVQTSAMSLEEAADALVSAFSCTGVSQSEISTDTH